VKHFEESFRLLIIFLLGEEYIIQRR